MPMAEPGGEKANFTDSLRTYVKEDQKAQGKAPPFKSKPRQASQHGPRLTRACFNEPHHRLGGGWFPGTLESFWLPSSVGDPI